MNQATAVVIASDDSCLANDMAKVPLSQALVELYFTTAFSLRATVPSDRFVFTGVYEYYCRLHKWIHVANTPTHALVALTLNLAF